MLLLFICTWLLYQLQRLLKLIVPCETNKVAQTWIPRWGFGVGDLMFLWHAVKSNICTEQHKSVERCEWVRKDPLPCWRRWRQIKLVQKSCIWCVKTQTQNERTWVKVFWAVRSSAWRSWWHPMVLDAPSTPECKLPCTAGHITHSKIVSTLFQPKSSKTVRSCGREHVCMYADDAVVVMADMSKSQSTVNTSEQQSSTVNYQDIRCTGQSVSDHLKLRRPPSSMKHLGI